MRKRISPATVISIVALFFSLTGGSFAAGYVAAGHHRYVITSLSQIAPRVRHALRGSAGPQGPAGALGLAPLTNIVSHNSAVTSLEPGQPVDVVDNCPSGDMPLTGGFYGENDVVTASYAYPDGWSLGAHLEDGATTGWVQAWVECIPGATP